MTIQTAHIIVYDQHGTSRRIIECTPKIPVNETGAGEWTHEPFTLQPSERAYFAYSIIDERGANVETVEVHDA